ncbi:MAG TPA: hypothetical protein VIH74_02620 [Candidatus Acidoferrum sp.]|jgi:hypothetical protein
MHWLPKAQAWLRISLVAVAAGAIYIAIGCGGNGGAPPQTLTPPASDISVTVSGDATILSTSSTRTFTASVANTTNQNVTWSVVETGGGSISADGTYTSPALPGTFTVKATAAADASASGTKSVPVVIPVGHIAGYDVGVDYHATGSDFQHTAFITQYHVPAVRQLVLTQLQGMVDRGATVISTRIWLVTEPGTTNFGESWRATFPLATQEETNLQTYAKDVAKLVGSGGNRPRLDIGLLYLGAADYTMGNPTSGLGATPISAAVFTSRVEQTTDSVLDAVTNVLRPDGVPVVDTIYMEGEVMIGAKANQDWFMTTHYPRFVSRVSAAGFKPSVYFLAVMTASNQPLAPGYVDADFPILDGHITMYWMYRSINFMVSNGLPLPGRIDFSCYPDPAAGAFSDVLQRTFDDADATLPSLGAVKSYGAVETYYFLDPVMTEALGQAFAASAAQNSRLQRVTFWTSPNNGQTGEDPAYPFAIEDYYPPPNP